MILTRANAQYDGAKHKENIRLIQAIQRGYFQLSSIKNSSLVDFDLTNDVFNRIPASATNASIGVVRDYKNLRLLVVGCGMETYTGDTLNLKQIPAIVAGWRSINTASSTPLEPYATAARSVMPFVTFGDSGKTWRQMTLIGHSFSGAVMVQLMILLRAMFPDAGCQTFTYGAPKSVSPNQSLGRPGRYVVEVRTHADPVPSIPPSFSESPMLALMTPSIANIGAYLTHPVDPDYVGGDGLMVNTRENSVIPVLGRRLAVEEWLLGTNVFGASGHSLETYAGYIDQTAEIGDHFPAASGGGDWGRSGLHPETTNIPEGSVGGGADEDMLPQQGAIASAPASSRLPRISEAARRRALNETLAEIGATTTTNVAAAMNDFRATGRTEQNEVFTSVTRHGVRMVYYAGSLQWIVKGKRVQRKLVRDMNNYLRSIGML